ncbi:hypothetical protein IFR04_005764 [Cadophora malorum]|uniref:Heterokaryon incompatibility domain-containing protein n=1 Tax=Cadophora malorum TaxID=108018 RepID=A0A8H7W882_9HELO|nr:hypothetical protein IFR04_005764 [Cadophora malorum]
MDSGDHTAEGTNLVEHRYSAKYSYQSLRAQEIRVLKLLPASSRDAILQGELVHVTLHRDLEFEAVSYVWGEPVFPITLKTGESSYLKITQNLADALRCFQKPDKPRMLWVDAVCINQSDIPEKNQQLPLMGEIYRTASTVLAWLGENTTNTKVDVESISLAGAMAFVGRGLPHVRPGTSVYLLSDLKQLEEEVKKNIGGVWPRVFATAGMDTDLNPCGIRALYESVWFTRMWIVQETTLARNLLLHFGDQVLSWSQFERMCVLIYLFVETGNAFDPNAWITFTGVCWPVVQSAHQFKLAYRKRPEHVIDAWFKSVALFGSRKCSDQKDHVYALLGILPPQAEGRVVIKADYSKHLAEVSTEVASMAFKNGVLQHLYSAGAWRRSRFIDHGESCERAYLPSWVPDHSVSLVEDSTTWWMQTGYGDEELVDRDQGRSVRLYPGKDPHVFGFDGYIVDFVVWSWTLEELEQHHSVPAIEEKRPEYTRDRKAILKLLSEIESRAKGELYCGLDPWKIAFLRTLLASCDMTSVWAGMQMFAPQASRSVLKLDDALQLYIDTFLREDPALHGDPISEEGPNIDPGVTRLLGMLHQQMGSTLQNFHFFLTAKGLFGLMPKSSVGCKMADQIVFLDLFKVPFLLHNSSMPGAKTLLGPCYLQGFMRFTLENRRKLGEKERFMLV